MAGFENSLSISASGMRTQAQRLRHVSENIANADTPGYHRKTVSIKAQDENGEVRIGRVMLDRSALERIYDPAHPMASPDGYYDGTNVNLLTEIADAREAQRSYEANLKMFDQVRQMSSSLLDLLRK